MTATTLSSTRRLQDQMRQQVLPHLLQIAIPPASDVQQVLAPLQADLPRACQLTHPKLVQSPLQGGGLQCNHAFGQGL